MWFKEKNGIKKMFKNCLNTVDHLYKLKHKIAK